MLEINNKKIGVIDLFCGIGGLTHGFVKQQFNVLAGIDNDLTCKYAFEKNNDAKFISESVTNINGDALNSIYSDADIKILVGCAPCQPFSSYTFKDKKKRDKEKWKLLYEFSRLIKETSPHIISMENVAQLLNFKAAPVFHDFIGELKKLGYKVSYEIVNCNEYGIPQNRKRLILLGSKFGEINLIEKSHNKSNYRTVKDAIGNLPPIEDGEISAYDSMHVSRKLSPLNKQRIINTPYGGSWKDWPEELILACHKKASGKSYPSVYGRMKWDEPSPTMTTHCTGLGNGRFGHPKQNRAISLREAALLQTFPTNYDFFDSNNQKASTVLLSRHIGNAVPVRLGEVVAESISKHLQKIYNGK